LPQFSIGNRTLGPGQPALIIGEVAQAHDGSLNLAHAHIDAIADAGADAVKFQTHIAAAESLPSEPWRVRFSHGDATRFDYWRRMEFTADQWQGLKQHAERRGLIFLSSPFSVEAVDLLERLGVRAWKIASGEVTNPVLRERIAATRKPVLVSSGMSSQRELDETVAWFRQQDLPIALLQCTSIYPCPPEKIGLHQIAAWRERYEIPTGLSDHSGTIYPSLAAAALGAEVLEVHVALCREMFGPDVCVSVTTGELRQLIEGVRFIERSLGEATSKDDLAVELGDMRRMFGRSVVAVRELPAGTRLAAADLTVKKPAGGIPAEQLGQLIGRRLCCAVQANEPLQRTMLQADDHVLVKTA